MKISIVGLGYVGTVSAACMADKGHTIWGVDINAEKVRLINDGLSPIIENGLADKIAEARRVGRLQATVNMKDALQESELCFVAVATPSRLNGQIDPGHLYRACEQIGDSLKALDKKQIVIIRSSVMPSTFNHCRTIFDSVAPGLVSLCANPEFLREGTAIRDFEEPPFTIIGTDDKEIENVLRSIYSEISAPIFTLEPTEALMVKYASNVFHGMKIAFANEIGAICRESSVNAEKVMDVFSHDTKLNISRRYLMPGFAFGGSCLPKDIRAMIYAAKESDLNLPLITSILPSNHQVIERVLQKISSLDLRRIGLIGLSFKSNTDDLRESPFVELAERLLGKGYKLSIYDPNVTMTQLIGANKEYINKVIPHLSQLLVTSCEDLADMDLLLVGHHYAESELFLKETKATVIELDGSSNRNAIQSA